MSDNKYIDAVMSMSEEELNEASRLVQESLGDIKFIPFPGTQTRAYFSDAKVLLYGGKPGGGKGLIENEPVLTPFGWTEIGKLKQGDAICSTDGTVQKVIAVYHRGLLPFYKITWSDGEETLCDEDHIWLGWKSGGQKKLDNKQVSGESGARKWITKEIYNYYKKRSFDPKQRITIPVITDPVKFNVAGKLMGPSNFVKRELHPYILGVLLADGCLTSGHLSWAKPDVEIADRINSILGITLKYSEAKNGCNTYRIPKKIAYNFLSSMGLIDKRSCEKFIPKIYLLATVDERWELARGLMDCDGWAEEDGNCYYGTTSKQLADDVTHLMRSLGAIVTKNERDPTYTYNGEKLIGKHFYTLRIKINNAEKLFTLERKKERCFGKIYQNMGVYINNIERIDPKNSVCIAVSHPNSLFVINNFRVTHNSALIAGLALQEHYRSLLIRRNHSDLRPLIDVAKELNGSQKGFVGGGRPEYKKSNGGVIHFMGLGQDGGLGSMQGEAHDFIGVDECAQISEDPVRTVLGWLRPTTGTPDGQRLRVVMGSNPPLDSTGDWLMDFFPCWLDETYPHPAKDGEIRWFIRDGGMDVECKEGDSVIIDGETIYAHSRTFIASDYNDNPYINAVEYLEGLSSMNEEQRKILMSGNFLLSRGDAERQLIPTEWIRAAQSRWREDGHKGKLMEAIGADVTGSGSDMVAICPLYENLHFGKITGKVGSSYSGPSAIAADIVLIRRGGCPIGIDMGGGYGGGPKEHLSFAGVSAYGFIPNKATMERTADKSYGFVNLRALAYWRLREMLDPSQDGGAVIALPPSKKLLSDLATPKFVTKMHSGRMCIQVEGKDEIKKRIRRSTDEGDAVAIALWTYMYHTKKQKSYGGSRFTGGKGNAPKAKVGYENRKRRR